MPGFRDFIGLWKNVGEVDLRPIRMAAEKPVEIAVAGLQGSGRHTLADRLRVDPVRPQNRTDTPVYISEIDNLQITPEISIFIVMVKAGSSDTSREQALIRDLLRQGRKTLVVVNRVERSDQVVITAKDGNWGGAKLLYGSILNEDFLLKVFVPAVLDLLPDDLIALGRQFPLFRAPVATRLINETCVSNAAYSFSTGIAESVPVLGIPLNVADMVILSKAQAFLVYKLGLAFGFSTRWQDYVNEFGSVIGSGFVWRQIARQLVGLIPVWGIIPKVVVAYAGTYVVGHVVLRWYLTGRHVTRGQMRELYGEAIARGKAFVRTLSEKRPRLRSGRRKRQALPSPVLKACANCGKANPIDANFCNKCGSNFPSATNAG